MFEAQRQRQKNRGIKRKTTPATCSNINKRINSQTPTHDRTTKRKRIVEKRRTQTTPPQQQKRNTPVSMITTKKQKATGRRRTAPDEGRIYKGKKKPREQHICDMQAWMDGKQTTEVVGVKDYTKPKSGKTAKFNNTDLKYYIKCGYCTVKSENEEQTQHRQEGGTHITTLMCGTPPIKSLLFKIKPTTKPRNTKGTPPNNTQPEPQALTEANLNLHNGMLKPQQPACGHNSASGDIARLKL